MKSKIICCCCNFFFAARAIWFRASYPVPVRRVNRPKVWLRGEKLWNDAKQPPKSPCVSTCSKRRSLGTRASWKPAASSAIVETKKINCYCATVAIRDTTLIVSSLQWTTSPTATGSVTNAATRRPARGTALFAASRATKIGFYAINALKLIILIACNQL